MKNRRIVSFLLALLMLVGCAALFSSCGGETDGIVELSKSTVEVDLADYGVVYGSSQSGEAYTKTFKQRMTDFGTALTSATGKSFRVLTNDRAKDATAPEILIGLTDREESRDAYSAIDGVGFAIRVTENKIAIVGSSNLLTLQAVQYFTDKYLKNNTAKSTVLTLHESATASDLETVVLGDSEKGGYYTHIYPADCNTVAQCPDYSVVSGDYRDFEPVAMDQITEKLKNLTKVSAKKFPTAKDSESAEKEVLFGVVNRAENADMLATLASNEWVIAIEGETVQVTSWNVTTLMLAAQAYIDLLGDAAVTDENGVTKVALPKGLRLTGVGNENWILDFPKPEGEGIELLNTMDASDDSLQFLYTGSGINADSYKAYCDTLKEEGYTVVAENSIRENLFTTFVNEEKSTSLYVAYNAYAYKDDYGAYADEYSKTKTGDKDVYDFEACFRIVSSPAKHAYAPLPDEKLLSKPAYNKVTDSAVTTMPIYQNAVGLMYVITLEDGSFVVFDSGSLNPEGSEHKQLWNLLVSLHTKIYGTAPSAANPVRIAAWVVTHAHGDHYVAFEKMMEWLKNASMANQMNIDYMLGNYPNHGASYPIWSGLGDFGGGRIPNLQNDSNCGFQFVKLHTGQKYYLANLEIEVLTTWEDLNPRTTYTSNDTNTVLRFSMSNASAPTAAPVTQLWTGDANRWQSRWMCAMYGDYLKADMVSVAHHGNLGCEIEFYDLVSPTAVWWPNNATAYLGYTNPNNVNNARWCFQVDHHLAYNIPEVKYIYMSGGDNSTMTGGTFTTLWLRANGPDYDNLQDAMTWESVFYNTTCTIKK